jgi:hypothetical protein
MVFVFADVGPSAGAELGPGPDLSSASRAGVVRGDLMGIIPSDCMFAFSKGLDILAGFPIYVFAPAIGKGADDEKCALVLGISCGLLMKILMEDYVFLLT